MKFTTLAVVGTMVSMATAYVNPIEPWGDSKWVPGTKALIQWNDENKEGPALSTNPIVDIFLMTGSDQQMVKLATIAEKINANTIRNYTYTVPTVAPIGKIYFIQITSATGVNAWTTRFTITDAAGNPGTLAPTGPIGSNPGATGAIVSGGGAATSTAGPSATGGAGTPTSGAPANPTATAAGNADKKSSASSVSGTVLSAAAAVAVGVAALMAF
ncbi:MAG: hypothetical protein J3R72DRAFT_433685 [Linnemannia gamsii]|nr:MAG: hypothetical protein J3R72DRAFT_433685 [Linnemannia gamsii]